MHRRMEEPGRSYAFGGTCLNAGCIPSKALLESSELVSPRSARVRDSRHQGRQRRASTLRRCRSVARRSSRHRRSASRAYSRPPASRACRVTASCSSGNRVEFTDKDGKKQELTAKHVVLAAGSAPTELRSLPFDGKQVIDSWGALELDCRAQASRRHRRRRHRSRTRQRLASSRLGSRRAGSARYVPADGRRRGRAKKPSGISRSSASTSVSARRSAAQTRRASGVKLKYTRRKRRAERRSRQGHRRDRPSPVFEGSARRQAPACKSMSAASSKSITTAGPMQRTFGRSATSCAARCWRTRARKRASWSRT